MVNHPNRNKHRQQTEVPSITFENVRERLAAYANWLGHQHEDMSYGLRSIADVEKLYNAHQRDSEITFPDERTSAWRRKVLGYDPLTDKMC